ncbi:MAG TPA: GNAT family N-acetyltransferase [Terriglobales bacterium]|nr:GNAT family N-acetyltransferase [Terriglobales bacterium]
MPGTRSAQPRVTCKPLTPERWKDLERLFGPRGACAGCWCMWFRLAARDFAARKGAGNRRALKRLVDAGEPTGLLLYAGAEPVGWCALAPRAVYHRLENSRVLAPVDDRPAWSVPCFFIARGWRRRGLTSFLLEQAKREAARRGAELLEGYPTETRGAMADAFLYIGAASAFRNAGFREAARRSPIRPIMRCELRAGRSRPRGAGAGAAPARRSASARGNAKRARPARRSARA